MVGPGRRRTGSRTVNEVPPCYVFHTFNAYDEGEGIVLDLVRHPRTFDTDTRGPNEGPPALAGHPYLGLSCRAQVRIAADTSSGASSGT